MRRTLLQLGVPGRDVDDVAQEVLRGIQQGLAGFEPARSARPESALRGWIFGICERQARSHRRAGRKRDEVLCPVEVFERMAVFAGDGETRLLDRERSTLLVTLLALLEPVRRAVVVAYELEQVPMVDVARALRIPVNTAWNRLRLGRADLRAGVRRMLGGVVRVRGGEPGGRLVGG